MKHFCPFSGLFWNSPFITRSLPTTKPHPVFSLSYTELLAVLDTYNGLADNPLDTQDSVATQYLLELATLNQYPGWKFHCAPDYPLASKNLLMLYPQILRLLPQVQLLTEDEIPGYAVSHQAKDLSNLKHWLFEIQELLTHKSILRKIQARNVVRANKEEAIARLLHGYSDRSKAKLAKLLPEWADLACGFPDSLTLVNGSYVPLKDAWKEIIQLSVLGHFQTILTKYTLSDVVELRDELEDNLELGTPQASFTLKSLRYALAVLREFSREKPETISLDALTDSDLRMDSDSVIDPSNPFIVRNRNGDNSGSGSQTITEPRFSGNVAQRSEQAKDRIKALLAARRLRK